MKGMAVVMICVALVTGCERKSGENRQEKNILQDYVETPLERSRDIQDRENERTKELTTALDEVTE